MCRLYEPKGKPAYLRLCYQTNRAGEKVELNEQQAAEWKEKPYHHLTRKTFVEVKGDNQNDDK